MHYPTLFHTNERRNHMPYILILTIHADPAMPPGYSEWGGTHTYMRELLDSFNAFTYKLCSYYT